jgi:hypothetical protein
MHGAIPPLPNTPSWRGDQLKKKHRDNFTFFKIIFLGSMAHFRKLNPETVCNLVLHVS